MNSEQLHIVLKDLFEEMQQTNKHLAAQHSQIEQIKEEIHLKENDPSISEGIRRILAAYESKEVPTHLINEIEKLKAMLNNHSTLLLKPLQKQVEHYHYLHKGLVAAAGLFIFSIVLIIILVNTNHQVSEYKSANIKYRHLRLLNSAALNRIIYLTDSIYELNPDSLKTAVAQKEREKNRQLELILMAKQKEEEARQLRKQAVGR